LDGPLSAKGRLGSARPGADAAAATTLNHDIAHVASEQE
jgi:hypothetical protein